MSPSSPTRWFSTLAAVRPGVLPHVLPLSVDSQAHDMLRVWVGEFGSGAIASVTFSLCALANALPDLSTIRVGSYP